MNNVANNSGHNSLQTPLFTNIAQSIDNQSLPLITAISTVLGIIAPYFKYLDDPKLGSSIPNFLLKRSPYFIVAGVSFTIMIVSRLPRLHHINSIQQGNQNQSELQIIDILMKTESPQGTKREWAEKILANPGNYSPFILVYASVFFIKEKEFEKGALLCVGGVCRSEIDAKISCDPTTASVPQVAMMRVSEAVQEYLTTEHELESWKNARKVAYKNFIEWDQRTPRNYSDTWVRLNSMEAFAGTETTFLEITNHEKKRLIDSYYEEHSEAVSKLD